MQDAEVASLRLAELASGEAQLPPATVFAMGGMAERHRQDVRRLLRRLPKELARVGGREWRDLFDFMERSRAEAEAARPPVRSTLRAVPSPVPTPGETPETETGHPAGPHAGAGGAGGVPTLTALAPPPGHARGNDAAVLAHHEAGVLGHDEMQALGVEEPLDVTPDVTEVGFAHVGPVGVHALEPLHRHAVEARVVVGRVVVERARVLLVAHHVAAGQAVRDQWPVHVPPVRVELGRS